MASARHGAPPPRAEMTIAAALDLADAGDWTTIEQLWRVKAVHVAEHQREATLAA